MPLRQFLAFVLVASLFPCLSQHGSVEADTEALFASFREPPREARPFVRWWWNGNQLNAREIEREIALMDAGGLGGFEINPIARPPGPDVAAEALEWPGPEWAAMVRLATETARRRGLLVDIIVGAGWPYGAENLAPSEMVQILHTARIPLEGSGVHGWHVDDLVALGLQSSRDVSVDDEGTPARARNSMELLYVALAPATPRTIEDLEGLSGQIGPDGTLDVKVPDGPHVLHVGVVERGFASVTHGVPGAGGTVLDHYDATAVRNHLERMSDNLAPVLAGRLGDHLRSAFVDSIELSGANWTDDIEEEFRRRRGYELRSWLPFVADFRHAPQATEPLASSIPRVRHDFAKTLCELFQERFVATFREWSHGQRLQARVQAYGFPWLLGMLEGYLAADIPEGNNWLRTDPYAHGYDVWSNYAASAGHLTGRRVISTEAMTDTGNVFRVSLEEIKRADDFNFLRGITHSVLHGFNYSPPEAGFPGWVRFGTFFSEHNTWWPYLRRWTAYNARLSAVWQATRPEVEVAVLAPRADTWSRHGLERRPFQTEPWYAHRLWESLSQNGAAADFVTETILRDADIDEGELRYGPMEYQLLLLAGVRSIEPETAETLLEFARSGGRIAFVGTVPDRSPGYRRAEVNDRRVRSAIQRAQNESSGQVLSIAEPPRSPGALMEWSDRLLEEARVVRSVSFTRASRFIYQTHRKYGQHDLYFLVNTGDRRQVVRARFNGADGRPWVWNPETGERYLLPRASRAGGRLTLVLEPFASLLLVFDDREDVDAAPFVEAPPPGEIDSGGPWHGRFDPVQGQEFERSDLALGDLTQSGDRELESFAGTVTYSTELDLEDATWIDLGDVKGVSEVRVDGHSAGVRWYGRHAYRIEHLVRTGIQTLEVEVTTTLYNYLRTRDDLPGVAFWLSRQVSDDPEPSGLIGPVRLARARRVQR